MTMTLTSIHAEIERERERTEQKGVGSLLKFNIELRSSRMLISDQEVAMCAIEPVH